MSNLMVLAPIGAFLSITPAFAQRCFETSSDSLSNAESCQTIESDGGIAGVAAVPFGATPDWMNDIRRQVGALQIADMNNDGLLDLVVGCFISNSFPPYTDWRNMIYFNTGGQLEAIPSWVSNDQVHTGDIQVADFNLDSYPDILSVNGGFAHSKSVIYFGSATGPDTTFDVQLTTPISSWALSAAAFDFDHDNDLDIITTNQSGISGDAFRPLYMYRNNAGVIETSPSWQSDDSMIANGIAVGDYDDDGWEDIAIAKWVNFECGIYRNVNGVLDTLPTWIAPRSPAHNGARGAIFGDVDDNGWLDLGFGYDPTEVFTNDNAVLTQTYTAAPPFSGVQDMKFHDVDRDNDLDLVEQHFSTGRCHIYLNKRGVLATLPSWTYDSTVVGNALALGDINGDGCDDLALGYSGDVSIVVFYAQCPTACPADTNASGSVDVDDLLGVISAWGTANATYDIAPKGGDGTVNVDDLLAVINAWGPCL